MGRGDLQHQHDQGDLPQLKPDRAGLAEAGQDADGKAPLVFEEFEPRRFLRLRRYLRQDDLLGCDLQRPGERAARFFAPPAPH